MSSLRENKKINVNIVMRADFSEWQKQYIRSCFDSIREALEVNATRSSIAHARAVFGRAFDSDWWQDVLSDQLFEPKIGNPAVLQDQILQALHAIDSALNANSLGSRQPQWVDRHKKLLDAMEKLAHTNADLQVVSFAAKLQGYGTIYLVDASNAAVFPPCIAIRAGRYSYICWMRPMADLTRNDVTGQCSANPAAGRMVDEIIYHYGMQAMTLFSATGRSSSVAFKVNTSEEFFAKWQKESMGTAIATPQYRKSETAPVAHSQLQKALVDFDSR